MRSDIAKELANSAITYVYPLTNVSSLTSYVLVLFAECPSRLRTWQRSTNLRFTSVKLSSLSCRRGSRPAHHPSSTSFLPTSFPHSPTIPEPRRNSKYLRRCLPLQPQWYVHLTVFTSFDANVCAPGLHGSQGVRIRSKLWLLVPWLHKRVQYSSGDYLGYQEEGPT